MITQSRRQAAGSGLRRLCRGPLRAARRPLRAGFSFTEVMFAVIILGIGFIMVAAIFPVAIQQAKNTTEETTAAAIARGAASYIQRGLNDGPSGAAIDKKLASNCVPLVPTGTPAINPIVRSIHPKVDAPDPTTPAGLSLWKTTRSNLILPDDPRYAFVYLWARGGDYNTPATWKPYVQLYIFPVLARATPTFTATDTVIPDPNDAASTANLMAKLVQVAVANDVAGAGGADLLALDRRITGADAYKVVNIAAAAEGAYVVIANDKITTPATNHGRMNGRIFRLGARRTDLENLANIGSVFGDTGLSGRAEIYELQPGNDFARDPGANGALYGPLNTGDNDDIVAIGNSSAIAGSNSTTRASDTADAYVIGRGYANPAVPAEGYEGAAMPIGAYTTFVNIGG